MVTATKQQSQRRRKRITLEGSKEPRVGRKRKPQPKEISKTLAGKFGARLLLLTEAARLDADKLGERIGKSEAVVNMYFSGTVVPPLNDWPKIAKALGVPLRELLPE